MICLKRQTNLLFWSLFFVLVVFKFSGAVKISLGTNYYVEFNTPTNSRIQFSITGNNITGWVGVGIRNSNTNSTILKGADFFIGGYNEKTNKTYGDDYHIPINSTTDTLVKDKVQNWNMTRAAQTNGRTTLTVSRNLNTTDAAQDVVIQNKTMHFILLYNNASDDTTKAATNVGHILVNLVTGNVPNPVTSTPPTTTPTTNSTVCCGSTDSFRFSKIPLVFTIILVIMTAEFK